MKEFFIGLVFLIAVVVLSGIGILLFPILIVLGWLLRLVLYLFFILFAIWLLGKFIIVVWERIKGLENRKT